MNKYLIASTLVFSIGQNAFADDVKAVDILSVQKSIQVNHAGWKARDTWLNHLSAAERKNMFGLQKAPTANLDFEAAPESKAAAATAIDWRNVNGVNWIGPMLNQGNCGSCVAFSVIGTLETQVRISSGLSWLQPSFSPQELFACGGGNCNHGWDPGSAAKFLEKNGVSDEACLPYTSGSSGSDVSCNNRCSDYKNRSLKIASFTTPSKSGGSVEAVKAALAHGPLATTMTVYGDFMVYSSGVYKHVTGSAEGGHAIGIYGYDDAKRAWLIRNSWGIEWGEQGFAWVSWDDRSGIGSDTWSYEIAPSADFLSVSSPGDKEYVSGHYALTAKGTNLNQQGLQFIVNDGKSRATVATVDCLVIAGREGECAGDVDTTTLPEGRYEVSVSRPTLKSQVREFYVINHEPQIKLTINPANGVDLNKPQSGRPEFDIVSTSTPVPVQHMEFQVIDAQGHVASSKANDAVLPKMRMGWRTNSVVSGTYTIVVKGDIKYNSQTYSVESNRLALKVK